VLLSGNFSIEEGNLQLQNAFDAGFVRVFASGQLASIIANRSALIIADCFPNASFFPFPQHPIGTLGKILDSGVIRLCDFGNSQADYQDTTTNPPTGYLADLVNAILTLIAQNYGMPSLTAQWIYEDSSAACFNGLLEGTVDSVLPDFSVGGFFDGVRRTEVFGHSCTLPGSSAVIYVAGTSSFQSLQDLQAAPGLKVVTQGAGDMQLAQSLLPNAVVTDVSDLTLDQAFDLLRNGNADATFDISPLPGSLSSVSDLRAIDSGLTNPTTAFFRKDANFCVQL